MNEKYKGIFTALLTPFNADESVNLDVIKDLIDLNADKGVSGFYVNGSTGEGLLMTTEERNAVCAAVSKANAGRTTLIAHVGAMSTKEAVELAKSAEDSGFDAVSAVAPIYYGYSAEAVKRFYFDIADSVNIPVLIYNYPAASGFNLTQKLAAEFFADGRFLGVKHTTNDYFALQQFKAHFPNIVVYNGFDEMLLAGLSMGADGGIGSTYNVMAEKYIELYDAFLRGDIQRAQALQGECNEIIAQFIKYGVMVSEKATLEEMGIRMGGCRRPFEPISAEGRKVMRAIAKSL